MSNSLWSHGLQHTKLPCSLLSLRVCSNSCPLNWWCHPAILSSVIPFSFCLQFFPASRFFRMSWLFSSSGHGVSALAPVFPMNIQDWFPLGWTGLISLQFKRLSRVFPAPQFECINPSVVSLLYGPTLTSVQDFWRNHSFDYMDLCCKVMSLLFNMLPRFVIAFLPRSKWLLISWLQSISTEICYNRNSSF